MYRQSPGRNHRSKGIKVKNVLQVCLLLAVCFWLIYQVKHSHDKKREFDESDAKASLSSDELRRLGRKDIQNRVVGTLDKDENHDEQSDEEEINGEEVDENKHDEDEVEDKKVDVKEDDEDEETDEHEQEKSDPEVDREQDLVDGEEREEDGDENETQNTDSEDGHGEVDKEGIAEDTDHDGDDSSMREEHYKADDASSAVTQNQHPENILEVENKESDNEETSRSENRKELEVEGGEVAGDGHKTNVMTSETKEDSLDNSANGSPPNNSVTQESNDHLMSNTTTEDHKLPSENVMEHAQGNNTESVSAGGSALQTIDSERRANSSISNVESTLDAKEFPNSSNKSPSENVLIFEASVEAGNNTETLVENNNEIEGEKSDTTDGTDIENLETTENSEVHQDAIDISDMSMGMDEKEVRTDLETLPEMQTEGANNEDAAE
ncbi:hypothetical protein ACS0TY_002785 [Phlomoides rotata]